MINLWNNANEGESPWTDRSRRCFVEEVSIMSLLFSISNEYHHAILANLIVLSA